MTRHKYRTLFRILAINEEEKNYYWCVLPEWNSRVAILLYLPKDNLPIGYRFYGKVWLHVDCPDDLYPNDFEFVN